MKQPPLSNPYESLRISNQLCFPLYACSKELIRKYRKPLESLHLTYTQYVVMMVLWEFGNMTEGELGLKVHLDSGTLTPLLKRLEKQGLLTRTRASQNERKLLLQLTESGYQLREKALDVPKSMQGCIPLSHEELIQLKKLLDKALTNMEEEKMSIYDFTVKTGKGGELNLSDYKGKVIMVVNTATGCGFTPQYAPIEQMYKDYHDQGLEILDIPCNQFGAQAPGTDDEIHEFCTVHFNTTFPQMKKADVNGENELPLYTYLKAQKGFEGFNAHPYKELLESMFAKADPEWDKKPDIKWNFTKFIVDREGNVVARFEPTADMKDVENCVKALL